MIANAMFYGQEQNVEQVSSLRLGPFSFTLAQIYISFISTLVVLPVNVLQVQLFRKARPKRNEIACTMPDGQKKKFRWKTATPEASLWFDGKKSKFSGFIQNVKRTVDFHNLHAEPDSGKYAVKKSKKKKNKLYPHWVIYVAWCSVFLSIITSGFFVILYSMEWGQEIAAEWLTAMVLSFLESVVFVQPIKVLALALILSYILKKPDLTEEDESEPIINATPGPDEELIGVNKPDALHRTRLGTDPSKYLPKPSADLDKMRADRLKELKAEAIMREIIVYLLFLFALVILAHHNKDDSCFLMTKAVRENFVFDESDSGMNMFIIGGESGGDDAIVHNIGKWDDTWGWLNKTLVNAMYAGSWYNGSEIRKKDEMYMKNRELFRIGLIRLRTQRFKRRPCKGDTASEVAEDCWGKNDEAHYHPGWIPMNQTEIEKYEKEEDLADDDHKRKWKASPWVFQSAFALKSLPFVGRIDTYLGGGYVLDLPPTRDAASELINDVMSKGWIDDRTKVMLIEFTVYSANINMFTSATLAVEYSKMGGAFNYEQVRVYRLHNYIGGYAIFVLICQTIYILFICYYVQHEFKLAWRLRKHYFTNFWSMLEFLMCVLGLVCIGMYGAKMAFTKLAIYILNKHESGVYVNFGNIAQWDEVYNYCLSILVFVSTCKMLKMLRFNYRIGQLGMTFKIIGKEIQMYVTLFVVTFGAFSCFGYLLFNKVLEDYHSFITTMESVFNFLLGSFNYYDFEEANSVLGPFYFMAFQWIVVIGVLSVVMSVINEALIYSKESDEYKSTDHEIMDYVFEKFVRLLPWNSGSSSADNGDDEKK